MARTTGRITIAQEDRFLLEDDTGRHRLFLLSHGSGLNPDDLRGPAYGNRRVNIHYSEPNHLIAAFAHDIGFAEFRRRTDNEGAQAPGHSFTDTVRGFFNNWSLPRQVAGESSGRMPRKAASWGGCVHASKTPIRSAPAFAAIAPWIARSSFMQRTANLSISRAISAARSTKGRFLARKGCTGQFMDKAVPRTRLPIASIRCRGMRRRPVASTIGPDRQAGRLSRTATAMQP